MPRPDIKQVAKLLAARIRGVVPPPLLQQIVQNPPLLRLLLDELSLLVSGSADMTESVAILNPRLAAKERRRIEKNDIRWHVEMAGASTVTAGRKQVVYLGNTGPQGAREWVVVQYRNLPHEAGERVMRVSQRLGIEPDPDALEGKWTFRGDIDLLRQHLAHMRGKLSRAGVVLLNKLSIVAGAARVHAVTPDDLERYFGGEDPGRGWFNRQGDFVYDLGQYEISIYTHVDPDPDGGYELESELYDKRIPKTMPNKRGKDWLYHYFGIERNPDLKRYGTRIVKEATRMIKQHERKTKAAVIAALLRARRPDLANVVAKAPEGAPLTSKTGMKLREDLGDLPQFANFVDDNWVHFGNHAKKYGDTRIVFTGALQCLLIHAFKRGKGLPMTRDYGERWVPKDSLVMKTQYATRYLDWLEEAGVVEKTSMPAKQALKVNHTKRDEAVAKEDPNQPVDVYVAGDTLIGMINLMSKYGAKMAAQACVTARQIVR